VIVAVARLSLYIPHSHSLKDKRAVLRKIVDRTQARFKLHVAEVGSQDVWQRAEVGFAVVSGDGALAEALVDDVVRSIHGVVARDGQGEVVAVDRDVIRYGEGGAGFGQGHGHGHGHGKWGGGDV